MFRILFQRNELIHSFPLSVGSTIVCGLIERKWRTTWNGPRSVKPSKLAQNVKTKEVYVLDPFSTKRMHQFPSSECGEHHSLWPRRKEVNKDVKRFSECKTSKTRSKRENQGSFCFRKKRMHQFPSSECGEHHSVWPRRKEVNNNVKRSSECKTIKTCAKCENQGSLCYGSFYNETNAVIPFLRVWGTP